jgi:hypothetical protein
VPSIWRRSKLAAGRYKLRGYISGFMELLTGMGYTQDSRIATSGRSGERMKMGETLAAGEPPRLGVSTKDVVGAFFGFLEPPADNVMTRSSAGAIARGVGEGTFAYTTGSPALGDRWQVSGRLGQGGHEPAHERRRGRFGERLPSW